jgi:hypothetical protein
MIAPDATAGKPSRAGNCAAKTGPPGKCAMATERWRQNDGDRTRGGLGLRHFRLLNHAFVK